MTKYGILLDKSVIISNCLGMDYERNFHSRFFGYLEKHPFLGIMTKRIKRGCQETLVKRIGPGSPSINRLYEMSNFIRVEDIPYSGFQKRMSEVKKFFNELLKNQDIEGYISPMSVSSRFHGMLKGMYVNHTDPDRKKLKEKTFWSVPEEEDMEIIAEAFCLKDKYNTLFIASADKHFTGEVVSSALEKRLGIKCGNPTDVLSGLDAITEKELYKD